MLSTHNTVIFHTVLFFKKIYHIPGTFRGYHVNTVSGWIFREKKERRVEGLEGC
jgi:hypothetical protein